MTLNRTKAEEWAEKVRNRFHGSQRDEVIRIPADEYEQALKDAGPRVVDDVGLFKMVHAYTDEIASHGAMLNMRTRWAQEDFAAGFRAAERMNAVNNVEDMMPSEQETHVEALERCLDSNRANLHAAFESGASWFRTEFLRRLRGK